jgi:hypothetical protein
MASWEGRGFPSIGGRETQRYVLYEGLGMAVRRTAQRDWLDPKTSPFFQNCLVNWHFAVRDGVGDVCSMASFALRRALHGGCCHRVESCAKLEGRITPEGDVAIERPTGSLWEAVWESRLKAASCIIKLDT